MIMIILEEKRNIMYLVLDKDNNLLAYSSKIFYARKHQKLIYYSEDSIYIYKSVPYNGIFSWISEKTIMSYYEY